MTAPHIRILPHDAKKEFLSGEALTTWIEDSHDGLKKDGRYLLVNRNSIAELPPDSLVLFRYGNEIVGDAIVKEYCESRETGRTLTGECREYQALIKLYPSSIRVYTQPIDIKELESLTNPRRNFKVARTYFKIKNWDVRLKLLARQSR
jgi:hypothetical protein